MTNSHPRSRGDKGIAIMMTALCLIPLMVFAAFGVDLASWYSRISYLQKAADAASLAGTVWMPDMGKATQIACDTLARNNISGGPDCGSGDFTVDVSQGATATSLRVTVTDPNVRRYFSQVFRGEQDLTRSAEAEYNLPIPLGSPLNFFGGDATKNTTHNETTYSVAWPSDYFAAARRPAGSTYPCNIGTSATENLGYWQNATTFVNSGHSGGSPRCYWSVGFTVGSGTTTAAPPDYDSLNHVPTNTPCNAFGSGNGRWESTTVWNAGARYTSGTGNRQCSWPVYNTSSLPSSSHYTNSANVTNRSPGGCNLGYAGTNGRWPASGGFESGSRYTGTHTAGNQFCYFYAQISSNTVVVADPDQIVSTRSPGFWAMIEGPGVVSTQGDAYSPRCYLTVNCSSVENASYRPTTDPDRGYWYVVKIPPGLTGNVNVRVYDASFNSNGAQASLAGDSVINATAGSQTFQTEYRMYRQSNPLDFSTKAPLTTAAANQTEGSCFWHLAQESSFRGIWRSLCNISGVQPGDVYLLNVRTNGTSGSGVNGYAVEACANGSCTAGVQPSVYAFRDMAMYNNISSGSATFYLAEVGPQYAGKTLVIELWDAGDASGNATIFPMRPSATQPRPVTNVPAADCEYLSDPAPNAPQTSSPGGATGVINSTPHASDDATNCAIRSTISGTRQFNGEWLRIRVAVPANYTCTTGINPETTAGSCWWGIRYQFSSSTTDVTTWQARIEGNPVHLTT